MRLNQLFKTMILSSLLIVVACNSNSDNSNSTEKIQIPIYKDAQNIKKAFSKDHKGQEISYNVKIFYPAKDIIHYYEEEMNKLEYKPYIEDYYKHNDRSWRYYIDSTIADKPKVAEYTSHWTDAKRTKRAVLMLKYICNKNDLSECENMKVHILILPFQTVPPPQYGQGQ